MILFQRFSSAVLATLLLSVTPAQAFLSSPEASAGPLSLIDLTVDPLTLDSSDTLTTRLLPVSAFVNNVGISPVRSSTLIQTSVYIGETLVYTDTHSGGLASGASYEVSTSINVDAYSVGTHEIRVCTDVPNDVSETDESNNCAQAGFSKEDPSETADTSSTDFDKTEESGESGLETTETTGGLGDAGSPTGGSTTETPVDETLEEDEMTIESMDDAMDDTSIPTNPDLTILEMDYEAGEMTYVLANIGTESVPMAIGLTIQAEQNGATAYTISNTATQLTPEEKLFYNAGAASTLSFNYTELDESIVEVCVDTLNLVEELNETNNCLSVTIQLPLPDFIVQSADYYSDGTATVTVVNVGVDANEAVIPSIGLTVEGEALVYPVEGYAFYEAGSEQIFSYEGLPIGEAVTVCVDSEGLIEEEQELNCLYVSIKEADVAETLYTDLYVDNVSVGEDYSLSYRVGNQGNQSVDTDAITSDSGNWVRIYNARGNQMASFKIGWTNGHDISYLNADSSQTRETYLYKANKFYNLKAGKTYTVEVCTDEGGEDGLDEVDEWNEEGTGEDNNCSSTTFVMGELPDLSVDSLSYDSDSSMVTAVISNLSGINIASLSDAFTTLYLNGVAVESIDWNEASADQILYLNAETSSELTFTLDSGLLESGLNTIKVCVDSEDDVTEGNPESDATELNNCLSVEYSVE